MSDLKETDREGTKEALLGSVRGSPKSSPGPAESRSLLKPEGSQGGWSQASSCTRGAAPFPLPGPFSALQPPPQLPGVQTQEPRHPIRGGGGLGGAGRRARIRPGPLFRNDELTSAPGAGPPTPPGLPAPRRPEWTLSTLFGD